MEPIFKHSHFTSLLKVWQFSHKWAEFLQLNFSHSGISLYELQACIKQDKCLPKLIEHLIFRLISNVELTQNNHIMDTLFGICKFNRFGLMKQMVMLSSFQLGHSLVNYFLKSQGEIQLKEVQSFQKLEIGQKYLYLRILINYVEQSQLLKTHKLTLHENMKGEISKVNQRSQKKPQISQQVVIPSLLQQQQVVPQNYIPSKKSQLKQIASNYFQKSIEFIILGIVQQRYIYIFSQPLSDRILILDSQMDEWDQILGKNNVKIKIIELIKKGNQLSSGQLRLLESLDILYPEITNQKSWTNAFEPFKGLIQQQQRADKKPILRNYLTQLQFQYSKFLAECYNSRWASKEQRKQFLKLVDQANSVQGLFNCLKNFYTRTLSSIQKCNSYLETYDFSLQTSDHLKFKYQFLRQNYLYTNVISRNGQSTLKPILKQLFEHSERIFYHAEYIIMSIKSMLGIIKNQYSIGLQKRKRYVQKANQQSKKAEKKKEEDKIAKKQKMHCQIYDSEQEESDQKSDKTVPKAEELASGGRRLRNKTKIMYFDNSRSAAFKKKNQKRDSISSKNSTNVQKYPSKKSSKMNLESETSQDEYTSYDGDSSTKLQKFEYKPMPSRREGLRVKNSK